MTTPRKLRPSSVPVSVLNSMDAPETRVLACLAMTAAARRSIALTDVMALTGDDGEPLGQEAIQIIEGMVEEGMIELTPDRNQEGFFLIYVCGGAKTSLALARNKPDWADRRIRNIWIPLDLDQAIRDAIYAAEKEIREVNGTMSLRMSTNRLRAWKAWARMPESNHLVHKEVGRLRKIHKETFGLTEDDQGPVK